ncbi:MAG: PilC/PilY family type IV pilus protein [Eikenella sp.]|nr:PilC/PilY family type IV pilus protein [Eikenella sp.]
MRVNKKHAFQVKPIVGLLTAILVPITASALVIEEDFTGETLKNNWLMPLPGDGVVHAQYTIQQNTVIDNFACLTAGVGTAKPTATVAGTPPRCPSRNDAPGLGALRLTPAERYRVGGIVSNFSFPTNEGVDITFTTYAWGGTGADGMTFFLADADKPATLGASGGSLSYSCSKANPVFSGVDGGYFGIGMDEWGNYVNARDNTNTGALNPSHPENRSPNAIGIRGAGSVNYNYFSNPDRFLQDVYTRMGLGAVPATTKTSWRNQWQVASASNLRAVADRLRKVCETGTYQIDTSFLPAGRTPITLSTAYAKDDVARSQLKLYNYGYLTHKVLPNPLATNGVHLTSRSQAKPIQYRIRITKDGKASVWYSYNSGAYQPVMVDYDVVAQNGPLPRAFRFGFTGATGGSTNNHEVTCFKAAPDSQSEGDAAVNLPDAKIVSNTQLFFSLYNPHDWTGQVVAYPLVHSAANNTYDFARYANWDASCRLNGGSELHKNGICNSTNTTVSAQSRNSRVFWTWNGSNGVSLEWGNLTATQQNSLQLPGEAVGIAQQRLEYLKGDISQEQVNVGVGLFRARKSLLGDVINSGPTWVGAPANSKYQARWQNYRHAGDALPENQGQSYAAYMAEQQQRTNVVYAGANDGFLHGFRSGANKADGSFDLANNDGAEVLAYMPASVLARIINKTTNSLNFSHAQYAHNFYNDASPGSGDVFYNGKWHTWLMSGLGSGGSTVYALDITNPSKFTNSNSDAGSQVIGEWSYDPADPIWRNLGNTYGKPVFGRFHDGNWGAVFGNGWCSSVDAANGNCTANSGPAGIYVMSIDSSNGRPSFTFISTEEGGTLDSPNGIAYVTPVDLDRDRIYDYAYAGDLKGNVWRFNLSANSSAAWGSTRPQKIFTTRNGQPISTKIVVAQDAGTDRDPIISFGTGLRKEGYLGSGVTYAVGTQSVYGLRDKTAVTFPSSGNNIAEISIPNLLKQTVGSDHTLSVNSIDWNIHSGWYIDLDTVRLPDGSTQYEQIIYNPHLEKGKYLILNSYIDGSSPTLSCTSTKSSGYIYPLNVHDGTGVPDFARNNPNDTPSRLLASVTGSVTIIYTPDGRSYLVGKDASGKPILIEVFFPNEKALRRISWREIFQTGI